MLISNAKFKVVSFEDFLVEPDGKIININHANVENKGKCQHLSIIYKFYCVSGTKSNVQNLCAYLLIRSFT